jgi:hypothetical protein|tara:strand:- start:101 stop:553 length:453 start_codon:yes stop_codon:yes gene_type:complete
MPKSKKKTKRGAPTKSCPECSSTSHARSSTCKKCGYQFYISKKRLREEQAANWQELKSGDIIKCLIGSGPYFLSREKIGEKIYMGHKGTFEVEEIVYTNKKNCGILARKVYPAGRRGLAREYIYMGEPHYDNDLNIHREAHKIRVVKKNG